MPQAMLIIRADCRPLTEEDHHNAYLLSMLHSQHNLLVALATKADQHRTVVTFLEESIRYVPEPRRLKANILHLAKLVGLEFQEVTVADGSGGVN